MASSIEKLGIPVVQITPIPSIAKMLGVNRILQGRAVPNPLGEPSLNPEQEKELRRRYVLKALELLQTDVDGPTVVTLEDA
jgi:glycine reductase complex component B subunit gamma